MTQMNREILFRGKSIVSGEWIYGVPISNNYITCILKPTDGLSELKGFQVKPETVGQYTGLKDKNGVKIFEGDIVRRSNRNGQKTISYVVEWCSDCCMFVLDCIDFDMEFDTDFTVSYGNEFEFVGNIHDNPELVRKD